MNSRRDFIRRNSVGVIGGAILGAGMSACGGSDAAGAAQGNTYLLVHGAWHSSLCWNKVAATLTAAGHRVFAIDLPGAGLNAKFPQSYITQDVAALTTEVSPLSGQGLSAYVTAITAQLSSMAQFGKVILVGHSFGGVSITKVAESVPGLIQRLVYLTAFLPVQFPNVGGYNSLPENSTSLAGAAFIADPAVVSALRINNRSTDLSYIEKIRAAFYTDVPTASFLPYAASLMPDVSLQSQIDDARGSVAGWGSVPRTYIRCTLDRAIPIALQDRMIADADAATPSNKTDIKTLISGHGAFASVPDQVASILTAVA